MFKDWLKLVTTDCTVIQLSDKMFVYPMYKNGSTSLKYYSEKNHLNIFKNKEISKLKNITVFLRNPTDRFISGVHSYLEYEKIKDVDKELKKIEKFETLDRHFIPQYFWLLHLLKYFNGNLEIKSVSDLYNLIPNRDAPRDVRKITKEKKEKIKSIDYKKYINIDEQIIKKYLNETVKLKNLIMEFKNVVS
jgi:hypothetical protein